MEMYIVLAVTLFMMISFILHKVPFGVTTMACCLILAMTGIMDVQSAFSGFGNKIVVLIAPMLALSSVLTKTSLVARISSVMNTIKGRRVQLLQRARLHSAPPFLSIQRLSRKKVTLSPTSCITQFIFCKTAQFSGGFPVIFAILFFSLAFLEKTDYNSSIVEARGLSPAFIAQIRPPAGQAPRKGVWQYGIYLYQFVSPGCL